MGKWHKHFRKKLIWDEKAEQWCCTCGLPYYTNHPAPKIVKPMTEWRPWSIPIPQTMFSSGSFPSLTTQQQLW